MRYLLLSCSDDKTAPPLTRPEMDALIQEHMRFSEKLRAAGKAVIGEALRPETEASRIRLKAGHRQVTDGWAKQVRSATAASSRYGRSGRCEGYGNRSATATWER